MKRLAALAVAALTLTPTVADAHQPSGKYATPGTARQHPGCQRIWRAFRNVGASHSTADWFAYRIAPRESGCVPQYVRDRDDWSYSTVGLNGITPALRAGWRRWCGHDVRTWAGYETDARCALAAYRRLGTRPWQATR